MTDEIEQLKERVRRLEERQEKMAQSKDLEELAGFEVGETVRVVRRDMQGREIESYIGKIDQIAKSPFNGHQSHPYMALVWRGGREPPSPVVIEFLEKTEEVLS